MRRRITRALLVALILGLGASWLVGSVLSRSSNAPVAAASPPAQDIFLTSADGMRITGTYTPGATTDAPAILLLHGNGASRAAMAQNAAWLAGQGYATLAIDFRGHGQSASASHSFGLFEARDARAAFDWLKARQQGARIGVIGISLGGAAALIGDAGPLPADAFVLQAVYPDIRSAIRNRLSSKLGTILGTIGEPFLSYQSIARQGVWPDRFSPLDAMPRLRVPVLVIGGSADQYTPPTETMALFKAAAGPKQVWIAPGLDHAATSGEESPSYRDHVRLFFARYLEAG